MDKEFKYYGIRNWAKFQTTTDKNGKSLDGRSRPYIRDYTDKETDSLYASLTLIQRYMLDGCRRLRGKHGRNLSADLMWIVRQLDVAREERHSSVRALNQLIKRGFLIPTNQQFSVPQPAAPSLEVEVNIDVDVEKDTLPPSAGEGEQEEQTLKELLEGEEVELPKSKAFDILD